MHSYFLIVIGIIFGLSLHRYHIHTLPRALGIHSLRISTGTNIVWEAKDFYYYHYSHFSVKKLKTRRVFLKLITLFYHEKIPLMRSGYWGNLVIGSSWTSHDGFGAQLRCMFNEESELNQRLANKETHPICCPMFIFVNKVLLVHTMLIHSHVCSCFCATTVDFRDHDRDYKA